MTGPARPAHVSAVLTDTTGRPLTGETVTFSLGGQSCSGTTDPSGTAQCQIPSVGGPGGNQPVVAAFTGDATYGSTDTSGTILVVTYDSLCQLSQQMVTNPAMATSLCTILRTAATSERAGALQVKAAELGTYTQLVVAARASGSLTPAQAALLTEAADLL